MPQTWQLVSLPSSCEVYTCRNIQCQTIVLEWYIWCCLLTIRKVFWCCEGDYEKRETPLNLVSVIYSSVIFFLCLCWCIFSLKWDTLEYHMYPQHTAQQETWWHRDNSLVSPWLLYWEAILWVDREEERGEALTQSSRAQRLLLLLTPADSLMFVASFVYTVMVREIHIDDDVSRTLDGRQREAGKCNASNWFLFLTFFGCFPFVSP